MKTKYLYSIILILLFLISCKSEPSLYFTYLKSNPDKPLISENLVKILQQAHLENIDSLAELGIIKAAGPFEGGGGIFILEASSMKEVEEILYSDPAISAQRFIIENHPMEIDYGTIYPIDTNYTMVFYNFYETDILVPEKDYSSLFANINDSLSLIHQLHFQDVQKSVFLLKNTAKTLNLDSLLNKAISPAKVSNKKVLWIAKESFEQAEHVL